MEIENGIKMIINEKEEGFYPCSDILGIINILEKEALNIREINLQLIKVQYCYKDKIIFHNKTIIKEETIKINDISKIYFVFKLPEKMDPSFEYPSFKIKTYTRHHLQGSFNLNEKKFYCSYIILIKKKAIIDKSKLTYEKKCNIYSYFINKGNCNLIVNIDNNYLSFDDNLNLNLNILNEECDLNTNEIKVTVYRDIYIYSNNQNSINEEEVLNRIIKKTNINKKTKGKENMSIFITENNHYFNLNEWKNPYKNFQLKYLIPSIDSENIKCFYNIKITLYFNSFVTFSYRPRVFIPIFVGHQSISEYNFQIKENSSLIFSNLDGSNFFNQKNTD